MGAVDFLVSKQGEKPKQEKAVESHPSKSEGWATCELSGRCTLFGDLQNPSQQERCESGNRL